MSTPSDLLNDPSRPACGCDHCTKHPSAWVEGSILARVRAAVRAAWNHRGVTLPGTDERPTDRHTEGLSA